MSIRLLVPDTRSERWSQAAQAPQLPHGTFGSPYAGFLFRSAAQAHSAPSQPVRLVAIAGTRCRDHFDLFEPASRRTLGKARTAGETDKSHVACRVVSPMTVFLSF